MDYSKLIEYIEHNKSGVIAIDGPSGSGKSTLGLYLEKHYDCLVFRTDDYFLPLERKTEARLQEPGGNLDYERMEKEIFLNLDKKLIPSNHFNCQTNQLECKESVLRKPLIVVEGVYSMHPLFLKYYDFKVFLEIDRTTQIERILKRSNEKMLQRFINEWIPLEDKYFIEFNVKKSANIVLENTKN